MPELDSRRNCVCFTGHRPEKLTLPEEAVKAGLEQQIIQAIANGYTDLYKQSLITLTEFEKMMGKKKFNELLGTYVAKPPGKLALVPESDPREAVDLTELSQEFSVLPDEE